SAAGVGGQRRVDRVAYPALEAAERLLVRLALGQLLVVVGPALAVLMPDLGDRGHVDRVVESAVAAQRQPEDPLPAARGHLDRGGAVVGGEVVPASEPEHLAYIADDGAGDDRADPEQAGQAGPGGPSRGGQLRAGRPHLAPER